MLISSKVSHSVLTFLEKKGISSEQLLDQVDFSMEFARDPSCWIDAQEMENFLVSMEEQFSRFADSEEGLIETVGTGCSQLKTWGVLDSVLRMMESSQEILSQPQRFLSYFISPPPPAGSVHHDEQRTSFELPVSSEQYPQVTRFLAAALAGLPTYYERDVAQASWRGTSVNIEWNSEQKSLFREVDPGRNMSPEFLKELITSLETSQQELEEKNRQLVEKNRQLELAQKELHTRFQEQTMQKKAGHISPIIDGLSRQITAPLDLVQGHLQRLQDYLVRSQQLVTLLVQQDRMDPQVKKAMKRVDWEIICRESPEVMGTSTRELRRIQEIIRDLGEFVQTGESADAKKCETDLNQLVERAIKSVQLSSPGGVRLDRHLLLDRTVEVDPGKMEQALKSFLQNAVNSIEGDGSVRVVTRPNGSRAEIEISDTGEGMDDEGVQNVFTPFYAHPKLSARVGLGLSIARSIVKMHDGNVVVSSEVGRGSTFLIDLPN